MMRLLIRREDRPRIRHVVVLDAFLFFLWLDSMIEFV
jgi:hypothetical protein